jgi:hypothetical protein
VAVVADALTSQVSGLPQGFEYSRATILTPGMVCSGDGESLILQAGENLSRDARGEALLIVITASSA